MKQIFAAVSALVFAYNANGAVIFNENFDSAPYTNGGALPTGFNVINYGQWVNAHATLTTPTSTSLSPTRSLEVGGASAQVVGDFGINSSAATPTTQALNFTTAFEIGDLSTLTSLNTTFLSVRDSAGKNLALIYFNANGSVKPSFGGITNSSLGTIASDTWYNLVISLPNDPSSTNNIWTAQLYDSTNTTLIGSATGIFATPTTADNYSLFTFANGSNNANVFMDNISANTVPEPKPVALLSLSILFVGLWARTSRKFVQS